MTGLGLTLLVALVAALALGAIAHRLRLPPMLGYIAAGMVVGPFTPGFVADREEVLALADIGVALLMFSIGLQFSIGELRSVGARILAGTPVQVALTMAIGTGNRAADGLGAAGGAVHRWRDGGGIDRRPLQGRRRGDAAHHHARTDGPRRVDRAGPADGGARRRPLGARQPRGGVDPGPRAGRGHRHRLRCARRRRRLALPAPPAGDGRRPALARAVRDQRRGHRDRHRVRRRGARREHRAGCLRRRAGAGRLRPDGERARRDRAPARAVQHVLLRVDRHPAPADGHPRRLAGRAGPAPHHHPRQGAADRRPRAASTASVRRRRCVPGRSSVRAASSASCSPPRAWRSVP